MTRLVSSSSMLLVSALAVMFMGCGDKTDEPEFTANVVKTFEDLPNCSQGKYAIVYYVMEGDGQFYYCDGWEYIPLNPPDDSCTVEDNGDGTKTVRCPDGTSVTVNNVECLHEPTVCEDGDACTADVCDQAVGCVSLPIDCDDGDACTDDSCDSATGCVHDPAVCDDGNICTEDSCDSAAGCEFTPVVCPPGEECNPDSGVCEPPPVCPCWSRDDLFAVGWQSCRDYQNAEPISPGLMLRNDSRQWLAAVGYNNNPFNGNNYEMWCNGILLYGGTANEYRYGWENPPNRPGHYPLRPQDWQLCWELIEERLEGSGLTCVVY